MRRSALTGLRARLLLGLLLTWAVTLAVVALALLQPLERQLRDDALATLTHDARAARVGVRGLDAGAQRPGDSQARHLARAIGRGANAQVVFVDRGGQRFAATDPDEIVPLDIGVRALREGRTIGRISDSGPIPVARVAVPAGTEGGPIALIFYRRLDSVVSAVRVVRRAVIVAALIGLVTALVIGTLLTRPLVRRLRGLRDTALRVARLGPNVEVAADPRRDEVGDLTRAFATMQDRLREQEHARRAFVSTASHELRTPVTSLRLMLDLLGEEVGREPPPSSQEVREQLLDAAGQAERLGRLTDELLDLSRLDAGVPLARELVDLRSVSRLVAHELETRAREGGRTLLPDASQAPVWAVADPGATAQIVRILLDNALRYGPEGTPVRIEVAGDGTGAPCLLRVRDEGPGVAAAEREAIFERFRRGAATSGTTGFGLGLAIGRELARRMGGELALIDDGEHGACFELRLVPGPGIGEPAAFEARTS
ncbi:MAG TPA: HAMP domain-containing sensor histidine kinase [Conexibacter sp.]|nr:HAMP domain-containing sensor histidine kinase [Conexibacter sp.]